MGLGGSNHFDTINTWVRFRLDHIMVYPYLDPPTRIATPSPLIGPHTLFAWDPHIPMRGGASWEHIIFSLEIWRGRWLGSHNFSLSLSQQMSVVLSGFCSRDWCMLGSAQVDHKHPKAILVNLTCPIQP